MLTLPIQKKWLDMICSGIKKEEYRAVIPYWTKRFQTIGLLDKFGKPTGEERIIRLRAGYGNNMPEAKIRVSISKGFGKPEWGADPGIVYWKLGIKEMEK